MLGFCLVAGGKSAFKIRQVKKNIWTICLDQVQQKCQNQCDKTVSSGLIIYRPCADDTRQCKALPLDGCEI